MGSEAARDAEFWLPSEFLADDFFSAEKAGGRNGVAGGEVLCFPNEFPYDYDCSNFGSPVGSNTETESDEEEFMAGLTRRMARSFLQDGEKKSIDASTAAFAADNLKASMACSPPSPLCSVGAWSKMASHFSSPPSPQEPEKGGNNNCISNSAVAWELLYAAAGEVLRMRLNEDEEKQRLAGRGLLGPPKTGYYHPNPALAKHQLQVNQFQQLKQQQQLLKQQQQCSPAWGRQPTTTPTTRVPRCGVGVGSGRVGGRPLGLSSWPTLQQQQPQPQGGSGMRAVFLNGPGTRRQSCGTGVFLPRRTGSPSELRKKPACSTVLVPARVAQALNLNLDDISPQPRFPGGFALDQQDAVMGRNIVMMGSEKSVLRPQPTAAPLNLPPEWTY